MTALARTAHVSARVPVTLLDRLDAHRVHNGFSRTSALVQALVCGLDVLDARNAHPANTSQETPR